MTAVYSMAKCGVDMIGCLSSKHNFRSSEYLPIHMATLCLTTSTDPACQPFYQPVILCCIPLSYVLDEDNDIRNLYIMTVIIHISNLFLFITLTFFSNECDSYFLILILPFLHYSLSFSFLLFAAHQRQ